MATISQLSLVSIHSDDCIMFDLPTLRAPGSAAKERKQSTASLTSSNLLKRRSLSVFGRRQASVSTTSTDSTAVDSDIFWSNTPSLTSSVVDTDTFKYGSSNTWARRHGPRPKSIAIVTPYDTLGCLMLESPNLASFHAASRAGTDSIPNAVQESLDEYSLAVSPIPIKGDIADNPRTFTLATPSSNSPIPQISRTGDAAPQPLSAARLFISDSPEPAGDAKTQHRRDMSTSTFCSTYSVYGHDSDGTSQRSSITSVGTEFEHFSLQRDNKYNSARHISAEYADLLQSPDARLSVGDVVDLVRGDNSKHAPGNRLSYVDPTNLRTLNEDEEAAFTPPAEPEVDLEVVTALQLQKQQKQQRRASGAFAHLRQPPVPPRSERRRSSVMSMADFSPLPSPSACGPALPKALGIINLFQPSLSNIEAGQSQSLFANDSIVQRIMRQASDFEDLFSLARVSIQFYGAFKKNELSLMQATLRNMSPAAWEFKQMLSHDEDEDADSAAPVPDHTPVTFLQSYLKEYSIIASLKRKIYEQCNTTVRDTSLDILQRHDVFRHSSLDDALWRIWIFSKIFGGGKDREDDLSTQLDWLKGGVMAHSLTATSSVLACDSWYATSALLSASEHFAAANFQGLDADQLYDMMEMWDGLRAITGNLAGQIDLARDSGVFAGRVSSQERSELAMLEEWHNYMLTCGLSLINRLASAETSLAAFQLAQDNRWTIWTSLSSATVSSRAVFLREPVNKLYEERILESLPQDDGRQHGVKTLPELIQQSLRSPTPEQNEEAGSTTSTPGSHSSSTFSDQLAAFRANTIYGSQFDTPVAYPAPLRLSISGPVPSEASLGIHPAFRKSFSAASESVMLARSASLHSSASSIHSTHSRPASSRASFKSSQSTASLASHHTTAPTVAAAAAAVQLQHPYQLALASPDPSTTSSDRAILRIVEMGFTGEQARQALKLTDQGEGLCVDRAVEYLLRC